MLDSEDVDSSAVTADVTQPSLKEVFDAVAVSNMRLVFRMSTPSGRCYSEHCREQAAKTTSLHLHMGGQLPQARSLLGPPKGVNAEAAWALTC